MTFVRVAITTIAKCTQKPAESTVSRHTEEDVHLKSPIDDTLENVDREVIDMLDGRRIGCQTRL